MVSIFINGLSVSRGDEWKQLDSRMISGLKMVKFMICVNNSSLNWIQWFSMAIEIYEGTRIDYQFWGETTYFHTEIGVNWKFIGQQSVWFVGSYRNAHTIYMATICYWAFHQWVLYAMWQCWPGAIIYGLPKRKVVNLQLDNKSNRCEYCNIQPP